MRYRLRTLMILLALVPPLLALMWFAGAALFKTRVAHPTYKDRNAKRLFELQLQAGGANATTLNESRHADPPTPIEVLEQRLAEAERELAAQNKSVAP